MNNSDVNTDRYNLILLDRDRHGGSVCAYIRNDLAFSERTDFNDSQLEIPWFVLLLPNAKPILIGTSNRPPKQLHFIDLFETVLISFRTDSEWYILGDFNICCKQT